jgi:hypothetical protein
MLIGCVYNFDYPTPEEFGYLSCLCSTKKTILAESVICSYAFDSIRSCLALAALPSTNYKALAKLVLVFVTISRGLMEVNVALWCTTVHNKTSTNEDVSNLKVPTFGFNSSLHPLKLSLALSSSIKVSIHPLSLILKTHSVYMHVLRPIVDVEQICKHYRLKAR